MIELVGKYFYLSGIILITIPWLFAFLRCKDVRIEMVLCGTLFGVIAYLTASISLFDYWTPNYIFEGVY